MRRTLKLFSKDYKKIYKRDFHDPEQKMKTRAFASNKLWFTKVIPVVLLLSFNLTSIFSQDDYETYQISLWFARNTTYVNPLKLTNFSVTISGDKISLPDGTNSNNTMYYIRDYPGVFPPSDGYAYISGKIERWMGTSLKDTKNYTNQAIDYTGTDDQFFFPGYGCNLYIKYYGWKLKAPKLANGSTTAFHCEDETVDVAYTNLQKTYNIYVGYDPGTGSITWKDTPVKKLTNSSNGENGNVSLTFEDFVGSEDVSAWYGTKFYIAVKGGNISPLSEYSQPLSDETGPFIFLPPFPDPAVTPVEPTCYGYTDASVRLDFSTDSISRYVFIISKLVAKTGGSCTNTPSGDGGEASDPNYCLTGESSTISGTTSNSYLIIDNSTLADAGQDGLKDKFGAGPYELQVKLKPSYGLSCIFNKTIVVPESPELILQNAYAKNSYSWNGETFQIQGYGATDTIVSIASGGHPPYRYSTNNGTSYSAPTNNVNYQFPTVLDGDYEIRITDNHNCQAQDNKTVPIEMKQPDPISVTGVGTDTVSCYSTNSGTHDNGNIQFSIQGGIGPFDISLGTKPNIINPDDDNDVLLGTLSASNYHVYVQDKYISGWDSVITVPSQPQLGFNAIEESDKYWPNCVGGSDGSLKVSGYGGKPLSDNSYRFGLLSGSDTLWTDKDSIINLNALQPYTVVIEDKLKCKATTSNVIIPQNPAPLAIVLDDTVPPLCNDYSDGKAVFSGINGLPFTGGYDFTLKNIDTYKTYSLRDFTAEFNDLVEGNYEIIIQDKYDCEINDYYRDTLYLSQPEKINISTRVRPVSRKGLGNGQIRAVMSGGNNNYDYEWYHGLSAIADSLIESGETRDTALLDNLKVGDYLLRIKDTCGCNNGQGEDAWLEWETHISEPLSPLSFSIIEHKNNTCNGSDDGRLIIEGSGGWGYSYQYGLDTVTMTFDNTFNNLSAGLYRLYVKDELDELFSDTVRITEPEDLSATLLAKSDARCHGNDDGTFDLTISGGTLPYYLSIDNNLNKTKGTGLTGLSADTYQVIVTDTNQCSDQIEITIGQPDSLKIVLENLENTTCGNTTGSLDVSCSGGTPTYIYLWSNSQGTVPGSEQSLTNLGAEVYQALVTDQNGCEQTSEWFPITNSDGPTVQDTLIIPVSCYGYSDGTTKIWIENGIPPYSFEWSTGATTDSVSGLISGTYFVTFSDSKNCKNTASFFVPSPLPLEVSTEEVNDPQCYGYSNGSIELTATGGTAPYQYIWEGGTTGSTVNDLGSGEYNVTISDIKGCIIDHSVILNDPESVNLDLGGEKVICTGQIVTLDAGNFDSYQWSSDNGFSSQEQIVDLQEQGNYFLEVADFSGCLGYDTFKITTSNSLLETDFLISPEAYVGDTVVAIDISWPLPDSVYWIYDTKRIEHYSELYYENLIFTEPGNYVITMYGELGECYDNYTQEIVVLAKEQTEDFEFKSAEPLIQKFNAMPNPNNGQFTIEIELLEEHEVMLKLFGNSLLEDFKKIGGLDHYNISYDLQGLAPGLYVIQLIAGNEMQQLKMIIY